MSDNTPKPTLVMPNGNVPIIGERVGITGWYATFGIECKCADKATPLLIVGVEKIVQCPNCKAKYRIGKIDFDVEKTSGELRIARVA